MGVLPLKKDSQELKAAVERALSEGPTLAELILRRPTEAAIDLNDLIGPREGVWRRQPPDFY
ncbi:MAG TPA: hypothetical protein VGE72_00045 [Azospirillum sp.]